MYFFKNIISLFLIFKIINNFLILPFETIYIKDELIKNDDYYNILFQNELYTNISVSTPLQEIKTLLKMDSSGFILYEGSFNYNLSTSIEKGTWDLNVGWQWRQSSFPAKDYFYFSQLNSYKDLDMFKLEKEKKNLIKTNKTSFVIVQKKTQSSYSNKNFFYYGLIGLKLNENSYSTIPEFVISLRKTKDIQSYTFSLKFNKDNYTYNDYFNNDNNGYFIVGEELTDDENEKNKIIYTDAQKKGKYLTWYVFFDQIYSSITNVIEKNNTDFYAKSTGAEFCVNLPYLIGTIEYLEYINQTFFKELIKEEICYFNTKNNKRGLYSFICNRKSEIFIKYLNNSFPDLIFVSKELEENFTLTKYDLFSLNNYNKSDTNIYFLVMFPPLHGFTNYYDWTLGIPFLKKYRLSFNYDTKKIGYYKYDGINNHNSNKTEEENSFNFFKSTIFKIICIIILIIIIFILGMLFQKKCYGKKKKKAFELNDDNYEYESYDNINNGINN